MMFAKALRARIRAGEITTSVRLWQAPRVSVGRRYRLLDGWIEVTRLREVDLADVTEQMARDGGFADLEALMRTARHGRGERVFVVDFVWVSDSGG